MIQYSSLTVILYLLPQKPLDMLLEVQRPVDKGTLHIPDVPR